MRAESDKRTVYKTDCSDSISLKKAYKEGKEILAKAGITEADLDAWYLLEFVTGITKARYYMDPDQSMDPEAWKKYKEYLEKRRNLSISRCSILPGVHILWDTNFVWMNVYLYRDRIQRCLWKRHWR